MTPSMVFVETGLLKPPSMASKIALRFASGDSASNRLLRSCQLLHCGTLGNPG